MDTRKTKQRDTSAASPANVSVAATQRAHRPRALYRVFFGHDGLRAGWEIFLFLLLFIGSNYLVSYFHLLPTIFDKIPNQSSQGMLPLPSIVKESVTFLLAVLATLILSRIECRAFASIRIRRRKALAAVPTGTPLGLGSPVRSCFASMAGWLSRL